MKFEFRTDAIGRAEVIDFERLGVQVSVKLDTGCLVANYRVCCEMLPIEQMGHPAFGIGSGGAAVVEPKSQCHKDGETAAQATIRSR